MGRIKQMTKQEKITAWALTAASASLTAVIVWWTWGRPEKFLERIGWTDDVWHMPMIWVLAIIIALA